MAATAINVRIVVVAVSSHQSILVGALSTAVAVRDERARAQILLYELSHEE
jgi:hypothetical protein